MRIWQLSDVRIWNKKKHEVLGGGGHDGST